MKYIEAVANVETARAILAEKGIKFERMASAAMPDGSTMESAIVYFMDGACDVAFYLPIARALRVHEQPRPLSREILKGMQTI